MEAFNTLILQILIQTTNPTHSKNPENHVQTIDRQCVRTGRDLSLHHKIPFKQLSCKSLNPENPDSDYINGAANIVFCSAGYGA